jgi:enoyl-CoA hydratase
MEYKILKLKKEQNIALLTISRPEALNALNSAFFREMNAMLDELEKDKDLRVLIITGEGKAFVAGADIAEMSNFDSNEGQKFSQIGQRTFDRLENLPIAVIAAINGFALGGGLELTMACDIRIASTKAKMGQPEVNLGLIPGYAGTQRLARLIGMGNALYMLMTADMISGQRAYEMGLVQKITEPENLIDEAMNLAKTIAKKGQTAVRQVKYVTRQGMGLSLAQGQSLEANIFGSLFDTAETKEGISAFLEKREPKW